MHTRETVKSEASKVLLPLPPELKERILAKANKERRSMRAQILVLLEQALPSEHEKAEAVAPASA
ncbi:hypothetical protein ACQZ46_00805 [Agrobacterium salinitolerans]